MAPAITGLNKLKFAIKILSFNPLIIVSDTSPLRITKVDITNPLSPEYLTYSYPGVSSASDAVYNEIFEEIYVACASGKIIKIDATDLTSYSIIDTGDSNDLQCLKSLDNFYKLYAGTDDLTGEVLYIDQGTFSQLSTNIQVLQQVKKSLDMDVRTLQGGKLASNIQCLETIKGSLGLDIRVLTDAFDQIAANPIKQTDFHVYINGVEIEDVDLSSIKIYHAIGEKSTATFNVHRRHDELDTTVAGDSSPITGQNPVSIYIKDNLEFSGVVGRIKTDSDNESVEITAIGSEKANERRTLNIPLASLNEKLHPYHCLVDNEDIYNPPLDPEDENSEYYLGVSVDLGNAITQNISRFQWSGNAATLADDVIAGKFQPIQNWTYFWLASATNYLSGIKQGSMVYVGTSPASLTSDIWVIDAMSYMYQRQFDDSTVALGSYTLGQPPYKSISSKNGSKTPKDKWVDQPDGLYRQRDDGYNYISFAKQVAQLEYKKLLNIGGSILPKTSCDIDLMIDGYYFYGLILLTRINIDNTSTPGIYKNSNGFPVSVKNIQIDSGSMRVSLKCDNSLSDTELKEIDALYPDENDPKYLFAAQSALIHSKFDYGNFSEVE